MSFLDDIKVDTEAIVDTGEFSQSITATPPGGEARTINAIVLDETEAQNFDDHGEKKSRVREVIICTDAIKGLTNAQRYTILTIAGEQWTVLDVRGKGFFKAILTAAIGEIVAYHRAGLKQSIEG